MWAEAERKKAGCSRWSSLEEGDKYHSAPGSRLVLAPCHYRGLSPMWLLVLCPLLEPERPPLATRPPPQTVCSGPFKEAAGWTAELEMGPHKELLSATAASGGAQQPVWQPARFQGTLCCPRTAPSCLLSPCPAAVAVGPAPLACVPGRLLADLG